WVQERRAEDQTFPDIFVPINCAGLTAELARSELFGHVAGSFTDAKSHRLGATLRACGVQNLTRSAGEKAKRAETFEEALRRIEQAAAVLAGLQQSGDEVKDRKQLAEIFFQLN